MDRSATGRGILSDEYISVDCSREVTRRPLIVKVRAQSQNQSMEICDRKGGSGTGFSPSV